MDVVEASCGLFCVVSSLVSCVSVRGFFVWFLRFFIDDHVVCPSLLFLLDGMVVSDGSGCGCNGRC